MKKVIITLVVGIILVICVLIGVILYAQNHIADEEMQNPPYMEVDNAVQEVKYDNEFYRIKRCVDLYMTTANQLATADEEEYYDFDFEFEENEDTTSSHAMLNLLGEEYKNEFGINVDNIKEKYKNAQKESLVTVLHVYKAENTENVTTYFAYGMARDIRNNDIEGISLMVLLDDMHDTFAIYPAEYMQNHGFATMELGQELELQKIEEIAINDNNIMKIAYISAETAIQNCFQAYKELALYNRETAYAILHEKYKTKRFPTFAEYDAYIQNNYVKVLGMSLEKYSTEYNGDTTQYICIDQNDNYYIFNEYGAMDFDVQLDIYTLDTTEFLTKYNAGNYQERVILNLNKVQEALNQGDYRYIYNHLDETFKQNHFATLEAFSAYMQARYFVNNIFSFDSYQEVGDVASCTVNITNADNTAQSRQQTFIMQLGEGTNFVMSFQV